MTTLYCYDGFNQSQTLTNLFAASMSLGKPKITSISPEDFTHVRQLEDLSFAYAVYDRKERDVDVRFAVFPYSGRLGRACLDGVTLDRLIEERDDDGNACVKADDGTPYEAWDMRKDQTIKASLPHQAFIVVSWRGRRQEEPIISTHFKGILNGRFMNDLAAMAYSGCVNDSGDGEHHPLDIIIIDVRSKRVVWSSDIFLDGMTAEKDREDTYLGTPT